MEKLKDLNSINKILSELSEGQMNHFSDLYDQMGPYIRGLLFRLIPQSSGPIVDDLMQETFIRIWKGLPRFEGKSSLKTWITRITVNVASDEKRKFVQKEKFLSSMSPQKEGSSEKNLIFPESEWRGLDQEQTQTIEEKKIQDVDNQFIREIINSLSDDFRQVIILHIWEDLSLEEIAQVLQIPIGTVKSRLHHARNKFSEVWNKRGGAA